MSDRIVIDDSLFPIQDDVDYQVVDGVIPTYDLRQYMSDTMRGRAAWGDFAKIASQVLYEAIEKQRIALGLVRSPENISRTVSILALNMLGLDYKSDLLRDADYTRALKTISAYNQTTKGREDFVNYMGFIKDSKFEIAKLWTTDYKEFVDGPAVGWRTVYDDPPGEWYPTTHVGLLYEEFANHTALNEDDLRSLFYSMAPITLVLEWIASLLTVRLNTLYLATNWYEETEDTALIADKHVLNLYLILGLVETTEDYLQTFPKGLLSKFTSSENIHSFEVSFDKAEIARGDFDWSAITPDVRRGYSSVAYVENTVVYNSQSELVSATSPVLCEYDSAGNILGEQIVPERWNYVPNSDAPSGGNFKKTNAIIGDTPLIYIDKSVCPRVTVIKQGTIVTSTMPDKTGAVTLEYHPGTSLFTAISRGNVTIVINNTTLALTQISGTTTFAEAYSLAAGFIRFSATMPGKDVTIYPVWGTSTTPDTNAAGYIYWRRLQVEDYPYPSKTSRTLGASPLLRPSTRITIPGAPFNAMAGFILLEFMYPYTEWVNEKVPIFEFIGPYTRLFAWVDTDGRLLTGVLNKTYRHNIPEDSSDRPSPIYAKQFNKLCVSWDVVNRKMAVYFNGWSTQRDDIDWPQSFVTGGIGRLSGENARFTTYLKELKILSYSDVSQMPTTQTLSFLTQ